MHTTNIIDPLSISLRLDNILKNEISTLSTEESLIRILSVIDLTTLEGKDTNERVIAICEQAKSYASEGLPNVAAVCFYPPFAALAKSSLKDSSIHVACVAGAFPSGQSPLEVRIAEVKYAVKNGADEIDMVISRGKFLEGDIDYVKNEIKAHKEACGAAHLKVILETGELETLDNIRLASDIAIASGADFIKTSTGKISPAATLEAFIVMLDSIKSHYEKTGVMIGIKPAGGISETSEALKYLLVLEKVLGEKWMNKQFFRIGASRLTNKVYEAIKSLGN